MSKNKFGDYMITKYMISYEGKPVNLKEMNEKVKQLFVDAGVDVLSLNFIQLPRSAYGDEVPFI